MGYSPKLAMDRVIFEIWAETMARCALVSAVVFVHVVGFV